MMSVAEAARAWQLDGVNVIPIRTNHTKAPVVRWTEYQARPVTLDEINHWWMNGNQYGLAVICGAISGNLEMTEIEGRAIEREQLDRIIQQVDREAPDLWGLLTGPDGYFEQSPNGGLHLLYRVGDEEVPGNTKIATKPDPDRPNEVLCLAETRGEGGYVIVAPTSGLSHPSGRPWELLGGTPGRVPVISWQQREILHQAIRDVLHVEAPKADIARYDRPSEALSLPVSSPGLGLSDGVSPGDDFAYRADWGDADLLGGLGWTLSAQRGTYREWTRAGKNPRDGISATTGRDAGVDRLYVFSTSTVFPTEESITKFRAYSIIHHGGDDSAAAKALRRRGFGSAPDTLDTVQLDPGSDGFELSDDGNTQRLWARVQNRYRYVHTGKTWYVFDGRVWRPDHEQSLMNECRVMAREMGRSTDPRLARWGKKLQDFKKIGACLRLLQSTPGASVSLDEFDKQRGLLNLHNGVLNLRTGELLQHNPSLLMTRMFNAAHSPHSTCENWEKFMESVLPDAALRTYVQRALGYTLLGDSDQRAMFLIYGPSGTGKSTMMETIRDIFGTYGQTAPSGTFKHKQFDHGPSPDLHSLRGSRFVSTSETAESTMFDEDLLKRITGRDMIQSRGLYESHIEWSPQAVLWFATNHPPRLNVEDDAIWRRLKMVPFVTQFLGDSEVFDMARVHLMPERNGILNWLLAGLRDFLAFGLGEPTSVTQAAIEHRAVSSPAVRFLEDNLADGSLTRGGQIEGRELNLLYQTWSRTYGERAIGSRRFIQQLTSAFDWLNGDQRIMYGVSRVKQSWAIGAAIPLPDP